MAAHDRRISVSDILRRCNAQAMRGKRNQSVKHLCQAGCQLLFIGFKTVKCNSHHQPVLPTDLISGCTSSSPELFFLYPRYLCHKRFSQEHIKSGQPRRTTDRCPPNVLIWPNTGLKDRESSMALSATNAPRGIPPQSFAQEQYVWYDIKLFKAQRLPFRPKPHCISSSTNKARFPNSVYARLLANRWQGLTPASA